MDIKEIDAVTGVVTHRLYTQADYDAITQMRIDIIPTWKNIRAERDSLISSCDWTQISDTPLSTSVKASWATYRQSLRDITDDYSTPADVVWPTAP